MTNITTPMLRLNGFLYRTTFLLLLKSLHPFTPAQKLLRLYDWHYTLCGGFLQYPKLQKVQISRSAWRPRN